MERDLSTIQSYKCWEMGHYSRECSKLLTFHNRKNMGSFTQRFFTKEKGKIQVHLIKLMNERWEFFLMGLEKTLKILQDVVDVMAQIKQLVENTTHSNTNVIRFKEMARCRHPSFGLATKARFCKGASQEGSLGVTSCVPKSVGECERMNPHTPKWTPILGVGVPMDFWTFKEW
jgi:hypothetical protein